MESNFAIKISNFVFTDCQPYHLFEPFLDMSLPIAFEFEHQKPNEVVSLWNCIFQTYNMYITVNLRMTAEQENDIIAW